LVNGDGDGQRRGHGRLGGDAAGAGVLAGH
jgi:hypothetical protein